MLSKTKEQLFHYLSTDLFCQAHQFKYQFIVIKSNEALSNKALDLSDISDTNHDVANTRVILDLQHIPNDGNEMELLQNVDSDTDILCDPFFSTSQDQGEHSCGLDMVQMKPIVIHLSVGCVLCLISQNVMSFCNFSSSRVVICLESSCNKDYGSTITRSCLTGRGIYTHAPSECTVRTVSAPV